MLVPSKEEEIWTCCKCGNGPMLAVLNERCVECHFEKCPYCSVDFTKLRSATSKHVANLRSEQNQDETFDKSSAGGRLEKPQISTSSHIVQQLSADKPVGQSINTLNEPEESPDISTPEVTSPSPSANADEVESPDISTSEDASLSPIANVDEMKPPKNLDPLELPAPKIAFVSGHISGGGSASWNLPLRSRNIKASPHPVRGFVAPEGAPRQSKQLMMVAAFERTEESDSDDHGSERSKLFETISKEPRWRGPLKEEEPVDFSSMSCSSSASEDDRNGNKSCLPNLDSIFELVRANVASFKQGVLDVVLSIKRPTNCTVEEGSGASQDSNFNSNIASTSSGAPIQHPVSDGKSNNAQKRPGDDDPDKSDDNDKRRRGKKPKKLPAPHNKTLGRRLACPFHQYDSQRYRTSACTGPGWDSVTRVKQHLKRCHMRPFQCPRCWLDVSSRSEMSQHLQSNPICNPRPEPLDDRISLEMWDQMTQRYRFVGLTTEEEKWAALYTIIFPNETNVPSPYYMSSSNEVIGNLQEYIRSRCLEVTRAAVQRVRNEQFDPMSRLFLGHLPRIMERVTNEVFQEYTSLVGGEHSVDSAFLPGGHESTDNAVGPLLTVRNESPSAAFEFGDSGDWQGEVGDWDPNFTRSSLDSVPQNFPEPDFEQTDWTYLDTTANISTFNRSVQGAMIFNERPQPQLHDENNTPLMAAASTLSSFPNPRHLAEPPTVGMDFSNMFLVDLASKLFNKSPSHNPEQQPRADC